MLPLRDENPTSVTPVITILLIVASIAAYFMLQGGPTASDGESAEFNLEFAAIPCEVTTGDPLTISEITQTFQAGDDNACDRSASSESQELFPDKPVYLAILFSMFFHGGLIHLGGNLLYLWIFGNNIEDHLGAVRFLLFYLVGGLVATVGHIAAGPGSTVPLIGASGAVAAAMGAYLVWFPEAPIRTLVFFIFRVDIRAKWVLGFWFLSQFFIDSSSRVAWVAHVAGFAFGLVVGVVVRLTDWGRRAMWKRSESGWEADHWDPTGGAGQGPYARQWPYQDDQRTFGGRRP